MVRVRIDPEVVFRKKLEAQRDGTVSISDYLAGPIVFKGQDGVYREATSQQATRLLIEGMHVTERP